MAVFKETVSIVFFFLLSDDSPTCDVASTPTKPSAEEKADVDTVPPEIIAKHKTYLKSMDNYEVSYFFFEQKAFIAGEVCVGVV